MRSIALIAGLLMVPGTAFAGSISVLSGDAGDGGSITAIGTAAPIVVKPKPAGPTLAPGAEMIRIEHVGGKTKIYRTEAWLGGSPVTYVSTATKADLAELQRRGIDIASTADQTVGPKTLAASTDDTTPAAASPSGQAIDHRALTGSLSSAEPKTPVSLDQTPLKLSIRLADAD